MENEQIHVALVEDDDDIRQTLSLIIDGTPGFTCMFTYSDCESALEDIPRKEPDVLLMDINLPGMSGIEGVARLRKTMPDLDILMLTVRTDDASVFDSLCVGATGYLLKHTPPAALLAAIRDVKAGGSPMSALIARKVLSSFRRNEKSPLSERESEILRALCEGKTYSSIANELFLSGHTVRSHIKNIYKKLHVNSRAEAVRRAMDSRWI